MNKTGCRLAQIKNEMDEADRNALDAVLISAVSAERISLLLNNYGWRISYQTVRRHQNLLCSCGEL